MISFFAVRLFDLEGFEAELFADIFVELLDISHADLLRRNKHRIGAHRGSKSALIEARADDIEFLSARDCVDLAFLFLNELDHLLRKLDGLRGRNDHHFDLFADLGSEIFGLVLFAIYLVFFEEDLLFEERQQNGYAFIRNRRNDCIDKLPFLQSRLSVVHLGDDFFHLVRRFHFGAVIHLKKNLLRLRVRSRCPGHYAYIFKFFDFLKLKVARICKPKHMCASTPHTQTQEVLFKMENNTEVKATNEMEEVVAQMDNGQSKLKRGQLVTAIISSASDEGVAVLLPFFKKEILLEKDEIDCEEYKAEDFAAKVGDEIEVMVLSPSNPVKLSQKAIKQLKEEEEKIEAISNGEEFDVTCTGFNKGGLTSSMGTYSVFVPAKEIRMGYVKELDKYVGKKLRLKALEIKKSDRKKEIIASQRVILEEEKAARDQAKAEKEAEFFANIHVGDVVEGKVERATNFGAFVSVNGFDCLAHISDLSWSGVKNVTDVLEIGKKYQFKVLKVDEESKKVSIGYKQLQPQPWDLVAEKYAVGDVVHGKVVRIVPFGAFVEVESGVDGLVHVSQISHEWLENPTSVLTIGEEIDAKIIVLDPANKKMTLSIKALLPEPEVTKVRPRRENNGEEKGERRQRKPRQPRENREEDEYREWTEGGVGGASIAEMLQNKNND